MGDIIIERSGGGPKQPVGRVVFFDIQKGDFSFSNFTSRIRIINAFFEPKFVFYFLHSFYLSGKTVELQAHTTGLRNLDFNKYKQVVRIPKLPTPEQRRIAYILSSVQKAIEQQDKLIKTTTELKKALMQKLFTEGIGWLSGAETSQHLVKQKQTEIGLVPESWEVVRIEKLLQKTKLKDPTKEPEKEFTYVDVSSVSNEFFRIDNASILIG